ncbi:hypothetical protein BCV70DRAFT_200103 [Testicularia cyperi]|uniref:Uncharacterized protein n=1 Tax=Testicularia cyperi TaxID=1882483 RepID=A0A317XNS1_9BASI|nr:hypothetical protein BCV70DRAFT_200103 [Testicularia cyperi]
MYTVERSLGSNLAPCLAVFRPALARTGLSTSSPGVILSDRRRRLACPSTNFGARAAARLVRNCLSKSVPWVVQEHRELDGSVRAQIAKVSSLHTHQYTTYSMNGCSGHHRPRGRSSSQVQSSPKRMQKWGRPKRWVFADLARRSVLEIQEN